MIDRAGKALDNGSILDNDDVSPCQCQPSLINARLQFTFYADNGSSEGESERERKLGRKRIVVANINRLSYSHARFPGTKPCELNSRDLSWQHLDDFFVKGRYFNPFLQVFDLKSELFNIICEQLVMPFQK